MPEPHQEVNFCVDIEVLQPVDPGNQDLLQTLLLKYIRLPASLALARCLRGRSMLSMARSA